MTATVDTPRSQSAVFNEDKNARVVKVVRPTVIALESGFESPYLPQPGSIGHFCAPKSSGLIGEMRECVASRDGASLADFMARLREAQMSARTLDDWEGFVAAEQWASFLVASPVYFHLQYGDRSLAGITAIDPAAEFGHYCVQWTASAIDEDELTITEYRNEESDSDDQLDHLIVISPRRLTEIEQATEDMFPSSPDSIKPCPEGPAVVPAMVDPTAVTALVVLLLVAFAFVVWTGNTVGSSSLSERVNIDDDAREKVRELGPKPSFRSLLSLRKQLFFGQSA